MSHAGDAFRAEAKELLDAMVAIEDKAAEAWKRRGKHRAGVCGFTPWYNMAQSCITNNISWFCWLYMIISLDYKMAS